MGIRTQSTLSLSLAVTLRDRSSAIPRSTTTNPSTGMISGGILKNFWWITRETQFEDTMNLWTHWRSSQTKTTSTEKYRNIRENKTCNSSIILMFVTNM